MLIAQKPAGPVWVPVMGCKVLFAPIDRAMMRRARRAALKKLGRDEHGPEPEGDAAEAFEDLGDELSYALIMAGAQDWQDVGQQRFDDADQPVLDGKGEPVFDALPFSAENLAAVLSDPLMFEAFDAAYVVPFAMRERAKNVSAVSPNGIGEAAIAEGDTASSPAKPKRKGAVKGVRTGSTRRKTKHATSSGTS